MRFRSKIAYAPVVTALALLVVAATPSSASAAPGGPPACDPNTAPALVLQGLPNRILIGRDERFGLNTNLDSEADAASAEVSMVGGDGVTFFRDEVAADSELFIGLDLRDPPATVFVRYVERRPTGSACTRSFSKTVKPVRRIYFPSRCTHSFRTRPRNAIIACGDGNFQLRRMRWRGWNRSSTTGRGIGLGNDCRPYCAVGHFHRRRIKVRLSRPRRCENVQRYVYTRFSWRYTHGGIPGARRGVRGSVPFPCGLFDLGLE